MEEHSLSSSPLSYPFSCCKLILNIHFLTNAIDNRENKWGQEDNEEVGPVRALCSRSQKCCLAADLMLNVAQS